MSPVAALLLALAAEHAALHLYGTLGARTSESGSPQLYADLRAGYDAHRARRDQLATRLRDRGSDPVPAEPAYELPQGLGTSAGVVRAARDVEHGCTETYAWLVGQTSGGDRRFAIAALTSSAVRELTFRGSPEIFPGADEYADR